MDLVIAESMLKDVKKDALTLHTEKSVLNRKLIIQKNEIDKHVNNNNYDHAEENYQKKVQAVKNLLMQANAKLDLYINNEHITKTESTQVEIFLTFLRVGEIDNVKERFQADAYFEASWIDNSVDPDATFDPRQQWEPELFLENAVANLKQDIKYRVERVDGVTKIHECRLIKGVFWERLELWDFPLDIQDLTITITSARHKDELKFVHNPTHESSINTNDFQQQQEWNLYEFIQLNESTVHDVWNNKDRPCISFSATISRKPGYFIYNAYMLIFLISVLGFAPFSFSYTTPHFRIQTTCLLILSSINFRWIVTQKLPTVSYLTTLDKYALGALIFLVMLCVWHAIIGSGLITTNQTNIDTYVLAGLGAGFVLFHLVYIAFFCYKFLRYRNIGKEVKDNVADENQPEDPKSNETSRTDVTSVNKVKLQTNSQQASYESGSQINLLTPGRGIPDITPLNVLHSSSMTRVAPQASAVAPQIQHTTGGLNSTRKPIMYIGDGPSDAPAPTVNNKPPVPRVINPKLNNPSNNGDDHHSTLTNRRHHFGGNKHSGSSDNLQHAVNMNTMQVSM